MDMLSAANSPVLFSDIRRLIRNSGNYCWSALFFASPADKFKLAMAGVRCTVRACHTFPFCRRSYCCGTDDLSVALGLLAATEFATFTSSLALSRAFICLCLGLHDSTVVHPKYDGLWSSGDRFDISWLL